MFALNLSLLGHNTDVHFRVPRDKRKKICQHLGGKPLKFAGLPNHVRISINYACIDNAPYMYTSIYIYGIYIK